jgi:hypothetical protein
MAVLREFRSTYSHVTIFSSEFAKLIIGTVLMEQVLVLHRSQNHQQQTWSKYLSFLIQRTVASLRITNVPLYDFFRVIPRRLKFYMPTFRNTVFHLHRQVCLWRWKRKNVPKRRNIKFRCRGIAQKKEYNIQNTAKVWNQEQIFPSPCFFKHYNMELDLSLLLKHSHNGIYFLLVTYQW